MQFYVAKAPALPFTVMALLAAGDPLAWLFALAGLLSIPKDDEVLDLPADSPLLINLLHWKQHGTQYAIELPIANIPIAMQETFHHDWKHSTFPTIWLLTILMQPAMQQYSPTQLNPGNYNKHLSPLVLSIDAADCL